MRSEPGEGAAVWLGQGERAVVQGHHKASVDVAIVGDLLREVRQHAWALGAEPVHPGVGEQGDECVALVLSR